MFSCPLELKVRSILGMQSKEAITSLSVVGKNKNNVLSSHQERMLNLAVMIRKASQKNVECK